MDANSLYYVNFYINNSYFFLFYFIFAIAEINKSKFFIALLGVIIIREALENCAHNTSRACSASYFIHERSSLRRAAINCFPALGRPSAF